MDVRKRLVTSRLRIIDNIKTWTFINLELVYFEMLTRIPAPITKIWRKTCFIKVVSSQQCHFSTADRPPVRPTKNNQEEKKDEKRKRYGHSGHFESNRREDTNHFGYLQNHIWTKEEINDELKSLYRHTPVTMSDKFMNAVMVGLYKTFNTITGYVEGNATVKSMEWRLLVLESVAGVPGFVAAGFRHFRSLRKLKHDSGWIQTLLEEAENERMHLLVCMTMFEASWLTRVMVLAAQTTMTPALMLVYLVHPRSMHRFVGYLEETACHTYASVIEQVQRPGTPLNEGWKDLVAPPIAISYWKLPSDAKFVDALKCMFADECHHRDVNHTFAEMNAEDPNPFVLQHKRDALRAMALESEGRSAWPSAAEIAAAAIDKKIPPTV